MDFPEMLLGITGCLCFVDENYCNGKTWVGQQSKPGELL